MVETKRKNKCIKLLGSIVLGLVFLCMCFVGLGINTNKNAKAEGEELASIYVDSGATTNITGGSVGSMSNGNSVYVADGGTLNVTGGTVIGNIYNGGTLNYTAGTLNGVTLASGKYITFKGNPSSTISITLDSPSVGTNIGYLDGISSVTLTRLSVTNLPSNTELRISGNYITIAYVDRTVSFEVDPSGYGTVSQSALSVPHGSSLSVSGATISYGGTSITATPAAQTAQYTYSFDGWYVGNTQITNSRTITANTTITARFTRTTRTYTVTIHEYNSSYGTVSPTTIEDVPYGTEIYRGSSITQLYVGETLVTATPNSSTAQYSYSVSSWREDSSSGTTITTTGFTLEGDKDIYVRYTRSTRGYYIYVYARYSTSSSGTNSGATAGITGGTATITYGSTDTPTTGSSYVRDYVTYNGGVTLTAEAKTNYVFVGWYSSTTSTTAVSTSSSYSLRITGTTYRYAFFRASTYTVSVYSRYINSSSGTNASATAGVTGGTASLTYGSQTVTTSGTGAVSLSVPNNGTVTLSASAINSEDTAITSYVFIGWFTSTSSTTAISTREEYSPSAITSSTSYYACFKIAAQVVVIARYRTDGSATISDAYFGSVGGKPSITYNSNTVATDNSNYRASMFVARGDSITLKANTRDGYVFAGWYSSMGAGSTAISTSETYTRNIGTSSISVGYYALYLPESVQVSVYSRYSTSIAGTNSGATTGTVGGSVSVRCGSNYGYMNNSGKASLYVYFNSSGVTIKATPAEGYHFVGWYTSASSNRAVSTEKEYDLANISNPNGVTYYAFFRYDSYMVTISGWTADSGGPYSSLNSLISTSSSGDTTVRIGTIYRGAGTYSVRSGTTVTIKLEASWFDDVTNEYADYSLKVNGVTVLSSSYNTQTYTFTITGITTIDIYEDTGGDR